MGDKSAGTEKADEDEKNMHDSNSGGAYGSMFMDNSTRTGTVYPPDICNISYRHHSGRKNGLYTMLVYVILGAAGLPVFSGFRAGPGVLAGPTGGYIVGFILIPAIMLVFEKRSKTIKLLSAIAALFICYAFGTVWYAVIYMGSGQSISIAAILIACVIPFILPDLLKIAIAYIIADRISFRQK